ncbi:Jag N-terminal domain-containing protein [Acholeplasma equirhinis]|uniref:RNA-binding cell elongation regulator Jag/EloR n=1 Tax=Acholeplasma equirhinis TaxID=555393 RepID=UPI00197A99D7|nr:RNA-binding cell elongation regulator Jag/EloR [Acholeplasma equirhinis]MBN3491045.1 Jag N-terminal domain-containing protein [Acholeplasma equirhinis]
MLKQVEIEAKTQQEALKKASELLKIAEDKIELEIVKEKKGFLGVGATTTFKATPKIDLTTEGKIYLEGIVSALGIDCKMEFRSHNPNEIYYRLQTSENALLIGKDGRTLLALQTLLRNHLASFSKDPILVTLDIGNYHENRKKQLEILATKTAKDVARTRIAVKLDPMNAFDRRIIHAKLAEWRDVETESEGEGDERAIIIKPKRK